MSGTISRSSLDASVYLTTVEEADIKSALSDLRSQLERGFSPDTAAQGFYGNAVSTGQCAAVSVLLSEFLGASMVSTRIRGQSHWFNRKEFGPKDYDFDLTGDQYELSPVELARAEHLYPEVRIRSEADITTETLRRAILLAERAGFTGVAKALGCRLNTHPSKP